MKYKDIPSIADIAIKIDFVAMCHDTPEHSKAWLRSYAEWLRIHHNKLIELETAEPAYITPALIMDYAKVQAENEQLRSETLELERKLTLYRQELSGKQDLGDIAAGFRNERDAEFWRMMELCRRELK